MLLERARRHYEQRGYAVGTPPVDVRADLIVEKGGRRRVIRLDEDPLGTYQIGALAAEAKRARLQATVICPGTPDVIAACEQFGVEHITPQGLGEDTPVIAAGRRPFVPPLEAPMPQAQADAAAQAPVAASRAVPLWRWGIVAAIWVAAIVAWTVLLLRIL